MASYVERGVPCPRKAVAWHPLGEIVGSLERERFTGRRFRVGDAHEGIAAMGGLQIPRADL